MGWLEAGVYPGSVSRATPSRGQRRGLAVTFTVGEPAGVSADVHVPFARIAELLIALGAGSLDQLVSCQAELVFDQGGVLVSFAGPGGAYLV